MLPLIDTSITNVALDAITHTLAASATQLELIVALYGVAFAVCLAMGSKLGDNYGRRRLFMWGVALFGIASLLCGIANNIGALLAARTLQGAGAALLITLQILATLHVTPQRPRPRPGHQPVWRDRRDRLYRRSDGRRLAGVGGHRRAGLAQRLFYQCADLPAGAGSEPPLCAGNPSRDAVAD